MINQGGFMSRSLKSLILCSCLFAGFFVAADFNKVEAAYGRWGAYNTERGAWGGNGGSWGNGHSDWYGEYGTPDNYYGGYYSTPYEQQHYYGGPGIGADAGIDGAGIYFNAR